ncbi:MAG TPA: TonB-dependent receptor [Caulobacteraceae bacterium]|jgi:outer membrane receptor protein involved in Fe transport|nr:TonB-dependent receptor [Caulobacteraceae bacterium]
MITSVALACSASVAHAQAAQNATGTAGAVPAAPASGTGATTVQEFVVTGSRIPQPNLTSVSPVTAVSSQEIKLEGTTRIEDLINRLPQVVADQGGNLSNGSTGTANLNLRGLGAKRNVVLVDGTRLGPGDPIVPVADINFIPQALVDRIDVLTGGASAVYGADAVAGVVNFVMKKDFEGLQIDINAGGYQHGNGDAKSQAANIAAGYTLPQSNVFGGQTVDVSAIFGANSPDGKGNVEGYVEYRHIAPIQESTRDYSNCSIAVSGKNFSCGGSLTGAQGTLLQYGPGFSTVAAFPGNTFQFGKGGAVNAFTGAPNQYYNFAPLNYFQRDDQRYSGGFFAHYDITPHLTAYAKFMFMDDFTSAQIAQSGDFGLTAAIPCTDPLLSPAELTAICVTPGYTTAANPTGVTPANPAGGVAADDLILRRNIEGGPRVSNLRHTDYRAQVGLKGDLGANWHFDVYGQYYAAVFNELDTGYFSNTKLANALDVIPGANGQPVCASNPTGASGGCQPYNIFNFLPGGVSKQALNYLEVPGEESGETTEQVVSASITGDLSAYGGKSPWAKDGVGVSFGAEYRREFLTFQPDEEFQTNDLAGGSGVVLPTQGAFDVKELFAEMRIPLIQNVPFFQDLTADLGYRFSHYNEAGNTNTYKLTGEWRPIDDILIRGGYNRAVRAPNVSELFSPQSVVLDGNSDPCASATPKFTAAQCALTGVSAAQYGNITANPASQYNGLTGGNPNLKPEIATTYTIGAVITPTHLVRGVSFSIDYFNIYIKDVIQTLGETNIINDCALNDVNCNLIHRGVGTGSLWLQPTDFVVDTTQNAGFLKTTGIDFTFDYRFNFRDIGLPDYGGLDLNFLGTYTSIYEFETLPGSAPISCLGRYGDTCAGSPTLGQPLPYWKSKTRLTWTTPLHGFEVSLDWRNIGGVNIDTGVTGTADSHIPAYNYFDLSMQYRVKDRYTFRVGVNNIADVDPPIIGSGELPATVGNGNTFPQVYDALGRYLFVGVTADF